MNSDTEFTIGDLREKSEKLIAMEGDSLKENQ